MNIQRLISDGVVDARLETEHEIFTIRVIEEVVVLVTKLKEGSETTTVYNRDPFRPIHSLTMNEDWSIQPVINAVARGLPYTYENDELKVDDAVYMLYKIGAYAILVQKIKHGTNTSVYDSTGRYLSSRTTPVLVTHAYRPN